MQEILARAVSRGECDPDLVTGYRIEAGPALLRRWFILDSGPIDDDFLVGLVDDVVLPLFGAGPAGSRPGS